MSIFNKNNTFFLISIGAVPGALLRWQMDKFFIINIVGCFLLGFFNSLTTLKKFKLILGVGLCGSMTTFSGLSFHLYKLLSQGSYKLFLFDSISIVILGFCAFGSGHILAMKLNS